MMTKNEKLVATEILDVHEAYQEYFSDLFFEDIVANTGLAVKTTKGVLGSLVKKGYVFEEDINGEENVYYLTEKGFIELVGQVPEYAEF